jgi:hypothetical protein
MWVRNVDLPHGRVNAYPTLPCIHIVMDYPRDLKFWRTLK